MTMPSSLSPLCAHAFPSACTPHPQARLRNTHVVENEEASEEGAQIEDKPPAAGGEGAHEELLTEQTAPCTSRHPLPDPTPG